MKEIPDESLRSDPYFSKKDLINSGLRLAGWLLVLLGGLLMVVPEFKQFFEEFEVDLPLVTELSIVASNRARWFWRFFVPVVVLMTTVMEFFVLSCPSHKIRKVLNILAWLALLLVFSFLVVGIVHPFFLIR